MISVYDFGDVVVALICNFIYSNLVVFTLKNTMNCYTSSKTLPTLKTT